MYHKRLMNIGTFSNITRGLILNKHTAFKEQSHVPIRHDCGDKDVHF